MNDLIRKNELSANTYEKPPQAGACNKSRFYAWLLSRYNAVPSLNIGKWADADAFAADIRAFKAGACL